MVDRVIELQSRAEETIRESGYEWFINGENDEYVSSDIIMMSTAESQRFIKESEDIYQLYLQATMHAEKNNLWADLGVSDNITKLISHDIKRNIPHICGRLDLAGGIENDEIKLIEFNADTATLLPETSYFQSWIHEPIRMDYKGQHNYLVMDMSAALRKLREQHPSYPATMLLTSLGNIEDKLNLNVISEAAVAAGFEVAYANLEDIVFSDDGVFIEDNEGYHQYHYLYKLIPWEFMMFEEPDLMDILTDLSIRTNLIVLNPAYTIGMQAKHMMTLMYELFPQHKNLLATYNKKSHFEGKRYVKKVNFGRLGENISIVAANGKVVTKTKGDFGNFTKVYQEFTEMYRDEDGDIYQAGMYMIDGKASSISFRRRDNLIIDEDAEFVSHVIF